MGSPATTTQKLGKSIARERVYQGMTQRELAAEAGVSLPALSRLERGRGSSMSTVEQVIDKLCLKLVLRRG